MIYLRWSKEEERELLGKKEEKKAPTTFGGLRTFNSASWEDIDESFPTPLSCIRRKSFFISRGGGGSLIGRGLQ